MNIGFWNKWYYKNCLIALEKFGRTTMMLDELFESFNCIEFSINDVTD